jgi:hypothetical protein
MKQSKDRKIFELFLDGYEFPESIIFMSITYKPISKTVYNIGDYVKCSLRNDNFYVGSEIWQYVSGSRQKCQIENCDNFATGQGYCNVHYQRLKRHSDVNYVSERAPRGTGHIDVFGYRIVSNGNGGKIKEHRLVMEKFLGRKLLRFTIPLLRMRMIQLKKLIMSVLLLKKLN